MSPVLRPATDIQGHIAGAVHRMTELDLERALRTPTTSENDTMNYTADRSYFNGIYQSGNKLVPIHWHPDPEFTMSAVQANSDMKDSGKYLDAVNVQISYK
jgi:hypothetical protein